MTLKVKAGNENINKLDYASSKKKNPKLKINQEIICLIMAENSKYTNKLPKRAIKLTNH